MPKYTKTKIEKIKARQTIMDILVCALCNHPILESWNIDHIKPISKGGGNNIDNLQITHIECNAKKGCKYKLTKAELEIQNLQQLERKRRKSAPFTTKRLREIWHEIEKEKLESQLTYGN